MRSVDAGTTVTEGGSTIRGAMVCCSTALFVWFSLSSNIWSSCFALCGEVDVVSEAAGEVMALLTGEAARGMLSDKVVVRGIFLVKTVSFQSHGAIVNYIETG